MKINKIILNNFRAFKYAEINIDDFNCIIGKNDAGKSTILAALEWFFSPNKELNEYDFAAAGYEWSESSPLSDEIIWETIQQEPIRDYIYNGFFISVDVYFSDVIIPNRTEESDFIFKKDLLSKEGYICIRNLCSTHFMIYIILLEIK